MMNEENKNQGESSSTVTEESIKTVIETLASKITPEERMKYMGERFDKSVEYFFRAYFEEVEGFTCCVDKARFTASAIKKAFELKRHLPLQETYAEYRDRGGNLGGIKDNLDEIAYWCPQTLKTTKEATALYDNFLLRGSREFIRELLKKK